MTSEDRTALIKFIQQEVGDLKAEISKHRDQTHDDSNGHYRAMWKLKDELKEDINQVQDKISDKIDNIRQNLKNEIATTNKEVAKTKINIAKIATLLMTGGFLGAGAGRILEKLF